MTVPDVSVLGDLIGQASSNTQTLSVQLDAFQNLYRARSPFNPNEARTRLESSLTSVEDFIVRLSESALANILEWDRQADGFCADVAELSGLMTRVKADTGAFVVGQSLCAGDAAPADAIEIEGAGNVDYLQVPDYATDINLFVLDNVGHHVEAIEKDVEKDLQEPLVMQIPAGHAPPRFWSVLPDYFFPTDLRGVVDCWNSSFAQIFGFNPVPPGIAGQ
jgi:hypothetical protein